MNLKKILMHGVVSKKGWQQSCKVDSFSSYLEKLNLTHEAQLVKLGYKTSIIIIQIWLKCETMIFACSTRLGRWAPRRYRFFIAGIDRDEVDDEFEQIRQLIQLL